MRLCARFRPYPVLLLPPSSNSTLLMALFFIFLSLTTGMNKAFRLMERVFFFLALL